jgi:hypothetical protein
MGHNSKIACDYCEVQKKKMVYCSQRYGFDQAQKKEIWF